MTFAAYRCKVFCMSNQPIERDDSAHTYYEIPSASKYLLRDDARVFRVLKDGKLRMLNQHLYKKSNRRAKEWRVHIVFDDGSRRGFFPLCRVNHIKEADASPSQLETGFLSLPELFVDYYVNKNGDVLQCKPHPTKHALYYKALRYYTDTNNKYTVLERISLRNMDRTYRTYTRKQLRELYAKCMDDEVAALGDQP